MLNANMFQLKIQSRDFFYGNFSLGLFLKTHNKILMYFKTFFVVHIFSYFYRFIKQNYNYLDKNIMIINDKL